jgi:hypothetical protein
MCNAKTLLTGVAPNTNIGGLIFDPLNLSGAFTKDKNNDKPPAPPDPAEERASTEAQAQQRANLQLSTDKRRRREQQSLIARGAPQPTLGDTTSGDSLSPIGGSSARATPAANTRASLISLGAAPVASSARPAYSGGGGGRTLSQAAY